MRKIENIETFKPHYSEEEVEELMQWFEQRMDRLPMKLQLSECLSTRNLPKAVASYISLIRSGRKGVIYNGYVSHLFLMRERLLRTGVDW